LLTGSTFALLCALSFAFAAISSAPFFWYKNHVNPDYWL
jgi:hypothetical protein